MGLTGLCLIQMVADVCPDHRWTRGMRRKPLDGQTTATNIAPDNVAGSNPIGCETHVTVAEFLRVILKFECSVCSF